ncbi:hypothetical protein VE03_09437 [Pseudogymnoascus sp. 23342-1-I1]|nr:hypothetical protein VE03_09437 [Pseudogymnoascus sp. 23342-1-I1]
MNTNFDGPWEEMERLKSAMIEKVIPRLLRPMESNGRFIKPSLVHGDLWYGNAAVDSETGRPLVYDPSSFYATNHELGNWRPDRNKFDKNYFLEYHSLVGKSEPVDDYDDRNALYGMRFNLQAAALFPEDSSYKESVIDEMKRLIAKYPNGYEEGEDKTIPTAQPLPASFDVDKVSIPAVGFGTFQGDDGNGRVKEAVLKALRTGYRHIDTALAYGNEKEVGEAIKESGIPRKDIFVMTKLAQTWHNPSGVEEALDQSLSNFSIIKIKRILEIARIRPAVNQVEMHPYLPQQELLDFCSAEGIHVTAHQPLGGRPVAAVNPNSDRPGPLLDPTINKIVESTGAVRYLDPKGHIGFDIFTKSVDEPAVVAT